MSTSPSHLEGEGRGGRGGRGRERGRGGDKVEGVNDGGR